MTDKKQETNTSIKIHTAKYVLLDDLPQADELKDCDISLAYGDGLTIYSKETTLEEIDEQQVPGKPAFEKLIAAINALPDGVLIAWSSDADFSTFG